MSVRDRHDDALHVLARENQTLLDTVLVGIVFVRERIMLRCNRRFEEIFGYAPNELDGRSTRVLYPDDEGFDYGGSPYGALAKGLTHQREQILARKDGSTFWCRLYGRAMDAAQPQLGSVWLFEDVSERKAEELAVRGLLLEQQAILDNASAGIVFLKDRVVQRCNRRFAEMLGYTPEELLQCGTRFMYPSDAAWREAAHVYPVLARGESHAREEPLLHRDGTQLWCRLTGRAVDRAHPELESVWLIEDVTEQRAAREDLELRVRERTAELAHTNQRLLAEMAEREQVENRVRHLANHDELTGLPNRRLLLDRLAQALALARRANEQLAVMFLDLDRFKTINDSLGHPVGDALLRGVAQRIVGIVREGDTVSRIGGDEFVILLPRIESETQAAFVAGKVMETLAQPLRLEGHELHVTASIGIALFPSDGETPETLLRNADSAMYHAKDAGRDNHQFFAAQMNVTAQQRLELENDLHHALQRAELFLHYQPRIDLARGRMVGVEALLRWLHPRRGVIHPGGFIALAEETGLIVRLGEWVLREVCRQILEWQRQGLPAFPVAVNLSPRQFGQRHIAERIGEILLETGVSSSLIELEITETSLMQHTEQTLGTLSRLHKMGLRLAIDDFGIGYSSLSYLKRFPVDQLKIDQSFVRDIGVDPTNAAIVAAIATLAHNLKLAVVAEGVETHEQLDAVRTAGCGQAQGFLFSRPVGAEHVPALALRRWSADAR
ncbi:EAL domain-containing protein [Aquincola sp. S2]|uniref:EAL domain-containing protein n=1 Tax=Pseudaquabacterium terrae TaxID=2732868 RepID=A0ABX2EG59_9BURK|nr:bifunctional diguanylate cyclase/phosphodiesterase [Aquabacterium terrae]NRF67619.1 EAL domain-containing protein [Aquabacterium terrae]